MPEDVNLSINGRSQVPPGFRFHPTEEELLHYYLRKKVAYEKIDLDVIRDVDLNKLEPWDIQERCKIGSTPQNDWYFFSHKDKKYPTGTRTNRATAAGFWKATGRDKIIYSGFRRIGLRKTLVFYKGRAPHGQKSDWIMHEYRLDDNTQLVDHSSSCSAIGEGVAEEGWVVCRVFRKKNYQKSLENPIRLSTSSTSSMDHYSKTSQFLNSGNNNNDHHGVLDQILLYMGRNINTSTCKLENQSFTTNINNISNTINNNLTCLSRTNTAIGLNERFMHLPRLDSPTCYEPYNDDHILMENELSSGGSRCGIVTSTKTTTSITGINDWVTLDRLVASQLNGQVDKQLSCFNDPNGSFSVLSPNDHDHDIDELQLSQDNFNSSKRSTSNYNQENNSSDHHQVYCNDNDLWSFATRSSSSPSSSDPLCHLSV